MLSFLARHLDAQVGAVCLATGILFLAGAIRLFQVRDAPGAVFNQAKMYVIAASLLVMIGLISHMEAMREFMRRFAVCLRPMESR